MRDSAITCNGHPVDVSAVSSLGACLLTGSFTTGISGGTAGTVRMMLVDHLLDLRGLLSVTAADGTVVRLPEHPVPLQGYDWPSEDTWRHLTAFTVTSGGSMVSMLEIIEHSSKAPFKVKGVLVAPQGSEIKVVWEPVRYAIDFGLTEHDEDAGLWLTDAHEEVWYKLIDPSEEYRETAERDRQRVLLVHQVYWALMAEGVCQEEDGLFVTELSLEEVHKAGAGGWEMQEVRRDAGFVMKNLEHVVDFRRSRALRKSMLSAAAGAEEGAAGGAGAKGGAGGRGAVESAAMPVPMQRNKRSLEEASPKPKSKPKSRLTAQVMPLSSSTGKTKSKSRTPPAAVMKEGSKGDENDEDMHLNKFQKLAKDADRMHYTKRKTSSTPLKAVPVGLAMVPLGRQKHDPKARLKEQTNQSKGVFAGRGSSSGVGEVVKSKRKSVVWADCVQGKTLPLKGLKTYPHEDDAWQE